MVLKQIKIKIVISQTSISLPKWFNTAAEQHKNISNQVDHSWPQGMEGKKRAYALPFGSFSRTFFFTHPPYTLSPHFPEPDCRNRLQRRVIKPLSPCMCARVSFSRVFSCLDDSLDQDATRYLLHAPADRGKLELNE